MQLNSFKFSGLANPRALGVTTATNDKKKTIISLSIKSQKVGNVRSPKRIAHKHALNRHIRHGSCRAAEVIKRLTTGSYYRGDLSRFAIARYHALNAAKALKRPPPKARKPRGRKAKAVELAQTVQVKKDLDFVADKVKLRLPSGDVKDKFKDQLRKDSEFLASIGVMDYSFLLGVSRNTRAWDEAVARGQVTRQTNYGWRTKQTMVPSALMQAASGSAPSLPLTSPKAPTALSLPSTRSRSVSVFTTSDGGVMSVERDEKGVERPGNEAYFFGIIDILCKYGAFKSAENKALRSRGFSEAEISCIPPVQYQRRFYTSISTSVE